MLTLARRKLDLIVGFFVLLAIIGVVFIALKAANISEITTDDGYVLHIHFENIGALAKRAPVKSGGVHVGQVRGVMYDDENHEAIVEVVIEERYRFPADSEASIASSSLLGGQYIALEAGGDDAVLQANDVLYGNSAIILEELISKFLFENAGE